MVGGPDPHTSVRLIGAGMKEAAGGSVALEGGGGCGLRPNSLRDGQG